MALRAEAGVANPPTLNPIQGTSPHGQAFHWLTEAIADTSYEFSLGAFGAVGQVAREPRIYVEVQSDRVVAVTESSRILLKNCNDLRPVAFESLSSDPFGWNPAIALCLPTAEAEGYGRTCWSEVGLDADAINPCERMLQCYDIGLGSSYADILIRPRSLAARRFSVKACGSQIDRHKLPRLFVDEAWIFQTRLGRVETNSAKRRHIIPQLLSMNMTHVGRAPIPEGYVSVGYAFPLNPRHASTDDGESCYDAWERLLDRFGIPELVRWKRKVQRALTGDAQPASVSSLLEHEGPPSRAELSSLRVALRQRRWLRREPIRLEWESQFDPALSRRAA